MALTAFEQEREARIAKNKQRIAELELNQAAADFKACVQRRQPAKAARAPRQLAPRPTLLEQRRSGRLANLDAVQYNDNIIDKADNQRTLRQFCASSEELYTEEHIKLLGDYTEEWVLFQDGYDENGNRIYDKSSGLTCHQCRQKTLGLRTTCSSCQSLKGVFCGDCLFMRYGENVKEAAQNPDWTCPDCRGICNCSIHRIRKGWAPTGSLYRRAIADGYKSVAHMLILSKQEKDKPAPATEVPAPLPAVPEEPAAEQETEAPPKEAAQKTSKPPKTHKAAGKPAAAADVAAPNAKQKAAKQKGKAIEKQTTKSGKENTEPRPSGKRGPTRKEIKDAVSQGLEFAVKKAKIAPKPVIGLPKALPAVRLTRSRAVKASA